jgi:hypothetical protein
MNVTLSLDDRLLIRARHKAEALGKSLDELVSDCLKAKLDGDDAAERNIAEFERLSRQGDSQGARFNREEIHTRGELKADG